MSNTEQTVILAVRLKSLCETNKFVILLFERTRPSQFQEQSIDELISLFWWFLKCLLFLLLLVFVENL